MASSKRTAVPLTVPHVIAADAPHSLHVSNLVICIVVLAAVYTTAQDKTDARSAATRSNSAAAPSTTGMTTRSTTTCGPNYGAY